MNFRLKLPTATDNFFEDDKWFRLKEPRIGKVLFYGNVMALLLPILLFVFWKMTFGFNFEQAKAFEENIGIWLIVSMLPIILFHELLHAIIFPDFGFSSKTTIVFLPLKLALFAYYSGEVSKNRYLLSGFTPFGVLTLIPLFICMFKFNYFLFWVAIINLSISSVDLIGLIVIYKNMPAGSILKNSGHDSYYRLN